MIEITIDTNGDTKVEVHNVTGKSCREQTKALREALGEVTDSHVKPEYYRQPQLIDREQTQ